MSPTEFMQRESRKNLKELYDLSLTIAGSLIIFGVLFAGIHLGLTCAVTFEPVIAGLR